MSRRISSDNIPPIVSRTNAVKMLNREGVLRTNDEAFAEEKLQVTMLSPNEPSMQGRSSFVSDSS